jgi:hypothetical protein
MKPQKKKGVATKPAPKTAPSKAPGVSAASRARPGKPAASPSKIVSAPKPARPARARAAKSAAPETSLGMEIPPVLLEGDEPGVPTMSGPGQRYALGPSAPAHPRRAGTASRELPEAYGTQKLLLTARDPHWLYAHWDLTREQLRALNAQSVDHHLVLRIHVDEVGDQVHTEVHVHPESRNWFVHVGRGGTRYVAVLGYYTPWRDWETVAVSQPTLTPPDALSSDTSVQFATIPLDLPFEQLVALVKRAVGEQIPLAEALLQLRAAGCEDLPEPESLSVPERWTPQQEQALARLISLDAVRRVWIGSLEITELVRRQLSQQVSSLGAVPTSPVGAVSSISSPFGGAGRAPGFWFNVNAELVVYGATEPDATVRIGERTIQLRRDGSFSYRFALPDGNYGLPITATAADGHDQRDADLRFSRATSYRGDVGTHPQDRRLKPPSPENAE